MMELKRLEGRAGRRFRTLVSTENVKNVIRISKSCKQEDVT